MMLGNFKSDKGGQLKVKSVIAIANLVFAVWFIYFIVVVAQHVNAWPFN